jgi:hypothetical protein
LPIIDNKNDKRKKNAKELIINKANIDFENVNFSVYKNE